MAQLVFKGPFHFDHLNDLLNDKKSKINNHGIYIWGFVMKQDDNAQNGLQIEDFTENNIPQFKITGVKLNNNSYFIPYYVGKVESESIAKRLSEHRKVRSDKNSRKYTRLSIDYYTYFFKDPNFKPNTGNRYGKRCTEIFNIIWPKNGQKSNKITYHNCNEILNKLYNLNTPKKYKSNNKTENYDYPITDYIGINDTLFELVDSKKNFWFCYAELNEELEKELQEYRSTLKKRSRSEFLKNPEAQTFYSLRGKTISETTAFKSVKLKYTIKAEPTCEHIFNLDSTTKEGILQDPNDPKSFPGYKK